MYLFLTKNSMTLRKDGPSSPNNNTRDQDLLNFDPKKRSTLSAEALKVWQIIHGKSGVEI